MTDERRRRQLAEALSVSWTSDLEMRVKVRIDREVTSRRRRRRQLVKVTTILATLCAGGVVFAFARAIEERGSDKRHITPPPRRPAETATPARADSPVLPPPAVSPSAAPAAQSPASRPDRERAPMSRRSVAKAAVPTAPTVADPVEALFVAADRARLAGRPGDAVGPLTEIQDRYPEDRRAVVAAFQLGRILADELGDPARAARAFDRARELAPDGPLAEDARTRADEARRAATTKPPASQR